MKNYIKMKNYILPFALIMILISSACNRDNASMEVRMTDAAGEYDKVNIDIQGISVKFEKDTAKWVELTANKGVYDLLMFQNGITTVVATGNSLPKTTVKEIRFVLGTNNSVVVQGVSYPLVLSSQDESGLKIKISKKLEKNLNTVTIDFDAAQSIVKENNGIYRLKPVLKLK